VSERRPTLDELDEEFTHEQYKRERPPDDLIAAALAAERRRVTEPFEKLPAEFEKRPNALVKDLVNRIRAEVAGRADGEEADRG
jgi:hypothetical protein